MGYKFSTKVVSTDNWIGDGFYADICKVININDYSKQIAPRINIERELQIEVEFEVQGKDWTKFITIGGDFDKDKGTGAIIGNGSAFKVSRFFEMLDMDSLELDDEDKIPDDTMIDAIGKECLILSYPNKEGKTSSWDMTAKATAIKTALKEEFLRGFNKSGYPKNYAPKSDGTEKSDDTDFPFGANNKGKSDFDLKGL